MYAIPQHREQHYKPGSRTVQEGSGFKGIPSQNRSDPCVSGRQTRRSVNAHQNSVDSRQSHWTVAGWTCGLPRLRSDVHSCKPAACPRQGTSESNGSYRGRSDQSLTVTRTCSGERSTHDCKSERRQAAVGLQEDRKAAAEVLSLPSAAPFI